MDALILWRMADPRYNQHNYERKRQHMGQRQWVIEARADFADPGKQVVIDEAVRVAAVHIHAQLALLNDNGVAPEVIARCDDWFAPSREIALHPNTLGAAIASQDVGEAQAVSEDMLSALHDMNSV